MKKNILIKNRIAYIDTARGIVILLMVLGHSRIPQSFADWIFSFHMPFFFILSGVLTNFDNSTIKSFVYHKIKTLIFPFLLYSICNIVIYPLYGDMDLVQFVEYTVRYGWEGYALWFVPILFLSLSIVKLLFRWDHLMIAVGLMIIIGAILDFLDCQMPWTLSTVPIASVFVSLGSLFRDKLLRLDKIKHPWFLMIIALCGGIVLSIIHTIDLAWNHCNPIYITLPAAFLGYIFIMLLSKYIEKSIPYYFSRILCKIGRETFVFVAFSQSIIKIINSSIIIPSIAKYVMLFVVLWVIIVIKNKVKNACVHNSHIAS